MIMIKIMMPDTAGSKNTRICSTYSNGRIVPDGAGARVVSLTLFRLQSPCSFNDNVTIIVAMQHEMGAGGLRTLHMTLHRATLRAIWWTETCGQR